MKICEIVKNDTYCNDFIDLVNYCFGIKKETVEYEIENLLKKDDSVVVAAIDDDLLQGALVINDFIINWCNKNVKMGGIGYVATFPEAREKHAIAKVLTKSLKIMKENNQIISMLAPFSFGFYRKYGWELGALAKIVEIDINDLANFNGEGYSVKSIDKGCIEQIKGVYEKCYLSYNGASKRTNIRWEYIFANIHKNDMKSYGVYDESNKLKGYIFYKLQNGVMEVQEIGYDSLSVKKHLLRFMYIHRAQVGKIKLTIPEGDNLSLILKNPKQPTTMSINMMVRVVDVKKVLEMYPYKIADNLEFIVNIKDEYAPWNNDTFEIVIKDNKVNVIKGSDKQVDVNCGIQAFSQIAFGFINWSEAKDVEIAQYNNKEVFEKLNEAMPKKALYVTDTF